MQDPRSELDRLFSTTYEELRRLAASVSRHGGSETLNPTALVNEAYLRLSASWDGRPISPLHFKRLAARAMRQLLVEAARRRSASKRGSGQALVTLNEDMHGFTGRSDELVALDSALHELAAVEPRQAEIVVLRFFGGFEVTETADILSISPATVARDWRAARSWLAVNLRRAG